MFDIDWQGTLQLSKYKELNLIKVFILPPNLKSLEERLKLRNQDDKASVKKDLIHIRAIENIGIIMIIF